MTPIELARKVATDRQAHLYRPRAASPGQYDARPYGGGSKSGWGLLDLFTAGAIIALYDALQEPENRARLEAMSIERAAQIAIQIAAKQKKRS